MSKRNPSLGGQWGLIQTAWNYGCSIPEGIQSLVVWCPVLTWTAGWQGIPFVWKRQGADVRGLSSVSAICLIPIVWTRKLFYFHVPEQHNLKTPALILASSCNHSIYAVLWSTWSRMTASEYKVCCLHAAWHKQWSHHSTSAVCWPW